MISHTRSSAVVLMCVVLLQGAFVFASAEDEFLSCEYESTYAVELLQRGLAHPSRRPSAATDDAVSSVRPLPASAASAAELAKSQAERRLHIISVTGVGKYEHLSVVAQAQWGKGLGPTDNFTNVCDIDCGQISFEGRHLEHILPMRPEDAFPSGGCENTTDPNSDCDPWYLSQMKFVWGFTYTYKKMASEGGPMPLWWFIKDDDTYVNISRLMAEAAKYDPSKRVLLASLKPTDELPGPFDRLAIRGGNGWLASAAMAQELVLTYGDQWLSLQESMREWAYDLVIGRIFEQVDDAEFVDMEGKGFADAREYLVLDFPPENCPNQSLITMHMKAWAQEFSNHTTASRETWLASACLAETPFP